MSSDFAGRDVKILDCTLRDGGYMNDWHFSMKMAREVYRAVSKAGVDIAEIGFRGSSKYFSREKFGLWRFSGDETIRQSLSGLTGAKVAVMGDFGKIDLDDFGTAEESPVDLIRLAVHKTGVPACIDLLEGIKEKGYEVSLNAMGYTSYTAKERENLARLVSSSNLDYVYVADSYGSIFPHQIKELFEPLLAINNKRIGFHPHNNLQMAFANAIEAIRCGIHIIDCTLYGIGRAAGNLPTEVILLFLELARGGRYNIVPVLNCIDTYLLPLRKEVEWGYQLPYMLSGMYRCHPNYPQNLVNLRQYNIEDICVAMEKINSLDPVGYSQQVLDKVIAEGIVGRTRAPRAIAPPVPYVDRHRGKDFLILANGPSLLKYKEKIERFIEKHNPVVLGANNLAGLFTPDYHVFNNKRRFAMYVDSVDESASLMVSQYFDQELVREYCSRPYEQLFYHDGIDRDFGIVDGVIQANCRTISVLLLGLAVVMGAQKIYGVGFDGYLNPRRDSIHFYNEENTQEDDRVFLELHKTCEKYIDQIDHHLTSSGRDGIRILTPTSYKDFYRPIDDFARSSKDSAKE